MSTDAGINDDFEKEFCPSLMPDDIDLQLKLVTMSNREIPTVDLLKVQSTNLQREFESFAAWLAVVGTRVEALETKLAVADREFERAEAAAYLRRRVGLKKTESTVKAEVTQDEEVQAAFDKVVATKRALGRYKAFRAALYAKKDMLEHLARQQRINT